jgi:hypothetical protein
MSLVKVITPTEFLAAWLEPNVRHKAATHNKAMLRTNLILNLRDKVKGIGLLQKRSHTVCHANNKSADKL